jgi:ribosome-associated protein
MPPKMRTSAQAAPKAKPYAALVSQRLESAELKDLIVATLEDAKAENVVTIDVKGKSSIGDYMVIATGNVNRHVSAISDRVVEALKTAKHGSIKVEGQPECNWVLIDTGPVIVHVFQPEAREFYKLEKMWSGERPVELVRDLTGQHRDGGDKLDRDFPVT